MDQRISGDRRVARILTIGVGILWLVDGLLQFLPNQGVHTLDVMVMGGWGQPAWLISLIDTVVNLIYVHGWSEIFSLVLGIGQVLVGVLVLLGPNRRWGRVGLYASLPCALVVWTLGEWLGGVAGFWSGGITFLNGGPGAVLLYLLGAWIVLPQGRVFAGDAVTRVRRVVGSLWVLGALFQSVPPLWNGQVLTRTFAESRVLTVQGFWVRPIVWVEHGVVAAGPVWNAAFVLSMLAIGLLILLARDPWGVYLYAGIWVLFIWWIGENFGGMPSLAYTDPNTGPAWAALMLPLFLASLRHRAERTGKVGPGSDRPLAKKLRPSGRLPRGQAPEAG